MTSILIGVSSGFLVILSIAILKRLDKPIIYGLILAGIGFLYVGFTWINLVALLINALQAIFFLFLAYFGVKKNRYILVAGYFLHGIWDLLYDLFPTTNLIPPHYDLFCLSIDFTIGFYLLLMSLKLENMKLKWEMPVGLKAYYNHELDQYQTEIMRGDMQLGWQHLERAHIIGQAWFKPHTYVHWLMFRFGIRMKNKNEILGQLPRLFFGGVKSFVGIIPVGNTGGTNVPPLRSMKIPDDLKKVLAPFRNL